MLISLYVNFLVRCLRCSASVLALSKWVAMASLIFLILAATNLQAATPPASDDVEAPPCPPCVPTRGANGNERGETQPSPHPDSPQDSKQPVPPTFGIENVQIDFHNQQDNSGKHNQFLESTTQFRLTNGNLIQFKTGFNTFQQPKIAYISNTPLQVGYVIKGKLTNLEANVGVDLFDRLPNALNFNAKLERQVLPNLTISGLVEQGRYKENAQTLENQITALRYGVNLDWDIDDNTNFTAMLMLGNYNDGNFEQQYSSSIEHKLGVFFVGANLFNWSYKHNVEETNGYFSPPDLLVLTGEFGVEGDIFKFLHCRLSTELGEQRLNSKFSFANSYEGKCTTKLSPNVDAEVGYSYSNEQKGISEGKGFNEQNLTTQLRIKF